MTAIKQNVVIVFLGGLIIGSLIVWFNLPDAKTTKDTPRTEALTKTPSRAWLEYAQKIVIADEPTPPESARLYAYTATAYFETLEATDSQAQAAIVTKKILDIILPEHVEENATFLETINGTAAEELSPEAQAIHDKLSERSQTDGFLTDKNEDVFRPTGEQYWIGEAPLSPAAMNWKTWALTESDKPTVPPPPTWGGSEHQAALAEVKQATINRTAEQSAAINYWGGVPGTVAPAGIWQNRLYEEVSEYNLSDSEYAYAQMVLAQALADSFIQCWKTKFTFWTRRPSMDDPEIAPILSMNNPKFPSYVSGHSTISRTAAEVLSAMFPAKETVWLADATEAKNSRLWGGIHFPYDNDTGFALGEEIGKIVNNNLATRKLR